MKIYRNVIVFTVLGLSFAACSSRLDVTDPNKFTDEEINKYKEESDKNTERVLGGMVNVMPNYVNLYDAKMNRGYSNSNAYESSFELRRFVQSGDVVEGRESDKGSWTLFYQNHDNLPYWEDDQSEQNYGYYIGPVLKIAAATKPLDWLNNPKTPLQKGYKARCLTIKAMGYMQLMERWTDLQDVTSDTKQGWPIYNKYAYNDPLPPLSVKETWKWLKDSLKYAVECFKASNIGKDGYTIGNDADKIHDVDCAVAQYIRARVALDMKDWATVIEAAKDLLTHYPNFIKAEDYGMNESLLPSVAARDKNKGWTGSDYNAEKNAFFNLERNPEAIFGEARGASSKYWDYFNTLKSRLNKCYQIDQNLYNAMSDNDCRKACFLSKPFKNYSVYSYENGDSIWYTYDIPAYTNLKWAATSAIGYTNHANHSSVSDFIYYRSSAVLLMLAEAYAQSGQETEAKTVLDKLLAARTLPNKPTMTCANTMNAMSVLDMVRLQWRIEMWGEGDWAFFNQKRWGMVPTRGANHWSMKPISHYTWEIPQQERQGNPYWK